MQRIRSHLKKTVHSCTCEVGACNCGDHLWRLCAFSTTWRSVTRFCLPQKLQKNWKSQSSPLITVTVQVIKRFIQQSIACLQICNSTYLRLCIHFDDHNNAHYENLSSIIPVFEQVAISCCNCFSWLNEICSKTGWWITTFHSEH